MSPSEIGFLALGLAVGTSAGAALLAVARSRSPLRPVVRVTVTPHAMTPRDGPGVAQARAPRLADFAPGSPDEDAHLDLVAGTSAGVSPPRPAPPSPGDTRTRVPSGPAAMPSRAVAIPIVGGGQPAAGPVASAGLAVAVAERPVETQAAMHPALPARVDIRPSRPDLAVRARPPVPEPRPGLAADVIAIPIVAGRAPGGDSAKGVATGAASAAVDACTGERTQAATACGAADAARDAARDLADRLRDAQRAHNDLQARVEEAGALADPRRLAAEKERLHAQFKAAHGGIVSAEDAEAAARDWLTAVSAANTAANGAARRVQSGTEELRSQTVALEKLDLEASAARIGAERAEAACRAAREALAACEERQRPATPASADDAGPGDAHWPGGPEPAFDRGSARGDEERIPVILRVLRGDTVAREQLVASLAAGDASATAAWHVRIAKFADAVTARAIEDGYLETDEEHPFWRLFSGEEQREIVQALSALGFRFDGMRGFADDRVPTARDLSIAVGYAGVDRMRIRTWPGETALAALFEDATVRADLWLATQADDLSLARVEEALGPRAAGLAELWDAWGRVRPAMLEER